MSTLYCYIQIRGTTPENHTLPVFHDVAFSLKAPLRSKMCSSVGILNCFHIRLLNGESLENVVKDVYLSSWFTTSQLIWSQLWSSIQLTQIWSLQCTFTENGLDWKGSLSWNLSRHVDHNMSTENQSACLWSPPCSFVSISVAWIAFTVCMSAGVSTLNNYTKRVLMVGPRRNSSLNRCSFNFMGLLPPAPYYTPPNPAITLACPQSPPHISHLSPYYEPPSAALPPTTPRLTHSHSLPLSCSDSFPAHPSHPAPASPFHRLSLPSPSPSYIPSVSIHMPLPGHQEDMSPPYEPEEDYSPLWTDWSFFHEDLSSVFVIVLLCDLNLHSQQFNESRLLAMILITVLNGNVDVKEISRWPRQPLCYLETRLYNSLQQC